MSESFEIKATAHSYKVELSLGLLDKRIAEWKDAVVICDSALIGRVRCDPTRTIAIDATENAKDLSELTPIMIAMKQLSANRQTVICAVGGGVVQDVACFVASVYMRGLKWVYFPTTLLGMADSCIGGKSSINAGGYKNLVGTFHPPESVHIDPELALSLSVEQKVAGLSEAAKICYAHTGDYFDRYLALSPSPMMAAEALQGVVALSLSAKKWFIETDEFDKNERQLLNFGHTFGHAIEAATYFKISHGVAVGIGMLCAIGYAKRAGMSGAGQMRTERLAQHVRKLLGKVENLKSLMSALDPVLAMQKLAADKKHDSTHFWLVTPDAQGFLTRTSLPKDDESRTRIEAIFESARIDYDRI